MPGYDIWTIGCQMNKADSARIASYLERSGYQPSPRAEDASIIVLNSCVVRQSAESRVVNKLDALKSLKKAANPLIILTGCMVGPRTDGLKRRFPHVDLFLRPQRFPELAQFLVSRGLAAEGPDPASILPVATTSAFVPIIEGCDNFCSYCIVPYRRGRERSRPLQEVVAEVECLVSRGTKEVILLGQNVNSYGHDLPHRPDLARLLTELQDVDRLSRIRMVTSHPKDMSARLIDAMAGLDKVCEHLSLPFQAGDNRVLHAMRRGYTIEHYRTLVRRIRDAVPGVALSTDVIVGFPGETREQFRRTLDTLEQLRFDTVHVAAYSPRAGTVAARKLIDDVPQHEKRRWRQAIEQLQEGIAREINARLIGTKVEVLVEGRRNGKWWGRTRGDKLVFFEDDANRVGQLVTLTVERTGPWSLQGRVYGDRGAEALPRVAVAASSPHSRQG
ncbi:MAG: tRNA (N6-isopentenyl adenosine(37)-C2)-methylthiotransferase MiaB [Chloroflexota bacterium]